jgi:hypothetical protein
MTPAHSLPAGNSSLFQPQHVSNDSGQRITVMCHIDDAGVQMVANDLNHPQHPIAVAGIQALTRFIQDEQPGTLYQRTR